MKNTDKPDLVSIVTIARNCDGVIEETIQSVISQEYNSIQYIVIDGKSTDKTTEIIQSYDSSISEWISEPDEGISDAFNKGIRRATGDLIGLLNAGDMYEPDAITRVVQSAQQSPNSDIFYGDIYMLNLDGEPEYTRKAREKLSAVTFRYAMPAIPHPSVFVRKDLYEERLFDPQLEYAMDFEWLRHMAEQGHRFCHVGGPCLARMRLDGKSNDHYTETLDEVHKICVKYGDNPITSFLYNKVFRSLRFQLRQKVETTAVGQSFLEMYRRLIVRLGLRNWEY